MSRKAASETVEETSATEELVEETELEETVTTEENATTENVVSEESTVETTSESVTSSKSIEVNTAATTAKSNKKMGVYKFLMIYPQDVYIETLLKHYYPKSFFTKDEWFQCIQNIQNTPIYN